MKLLAAAFLLLSSLCGCAEATNEPVVGGPCEGCEYVFVDMPKTITSRAQIAPVDEKGEALVVEGTVRHSDGKAASGIVVYAYQTDAGGIYPAGSTRHGRLRGWARTDSEGHYRFATIRPGAYPGGSNPQHIHMHVIEPRKATYFIDDVHFTDDPLLTAKHRQGEESRRGGSGIGTPERDAQGVWHVRRDIVLGENVPGYR
ncbi:MAG: hypothetical protein IPF53_18725 [Blastocatellia bacterium]|jgi:protocatechuate 3,4-dioxygenase beta subunit|nr:hypothetical protein [Blastocatellia bacterium]MBK6425706.1 hypothetical protein [Blastocatellia bacterium]